MSSSIKRLEDGESWRYRGEGAANLVLAYHGDDPRLIGKVLRLRKRANNERGMINDIKCSPILSTEEQRLWADWPGLVTATTIAELNHTYARDVLRPLLGDEHVDPGVLVDVSSSFVEAVNRNITCKRPSSRVENGSLDALPGTGLLISDHTYFPIQAGDVQSPATITVELKPKWGFLPISSTIREDNCIKRTVSRFTMHQHLKFNQGKIKGISKYDPLDLFSGTKAGIFKALQSLFETPQNNLRIFLNGEEVFGDSDGSADTDNLSISRLEDVLGEFIAGQHGTRVHTFQKLISGLLFESDVLSKLLAVQRLDYYDIEGAIKIYDRFRTLLNSLSENSVKAQERSMKGKETEESELQSQETQIEDEASGFSEGRPVRLSAISLENCQKIVRDFLIAATAKDCGLMLTLRPSQVHVEVVSSEDRSVVKVLNQQILHKIVLLDLDLKRVKKMHHYFKLDQEIVRAYKPLHIA